MARLKQDVIDHANEPVVDEEPPKFLIPTGSTSLNLACSNLYHGGYCPGRMVNFIGDSSSGKTMVAFNMFAEVSHNPSFDDFHLYYDEPESSLSFDVPKLFGKATDDRVDKSIKSRNIETFYGNLVKVLRKGEPFIYALDSFDSIGSLEEEGRADQFAKLVDDDTEKTRKDLKGTYGTAKPKLASELFRNVIPLLENTKSLLFIISQVRDNLKQTMFGSTKIRAGGKALKFYATHEIWSAIKGHIKKGEHNIGIQTIISIKKNKLTGREMSIEFPIYYDYGMDDIGSCFDFLLEQKAWSVYSKKEAGKPAGRGVPYVKTTIPSLTSFKGKPTELMAYIEENGMEDAVRQCMQQKWDEILESLKLNRKPRYPHD